MDLYRSILEALKKKQRHKQWKMFDVFPPNSGKDGTRAA